MNEPQDIISRIDTFIAECHAASCDDGESVASLLASCRDEIARLRCDRRWVSVGERPPDPWVSVLVTKAGDPEGYVFAGVVDRRGRWLDVDDKDISGLVTHWMPSPPPPQVTP